MQRFFDILLSGIAILCLSPLLLPIALLLRFTGEGEVLFTQRRVGKDGRPFKMYKFATMLKNSPLIGTGTVTTKDDPRVLPVGRLLRKTKINELPQLLNIFMGDMSIVGPRPQDQRCFDVFPIESQRLIVKVRPGLSGIGSIVFRAEEEILGAEAGSIEFYDEVIAPYKAKLETWYVENNDIITYFKIIYATMIVVINPNSRIVWRTFRKLPEPPEALKLLLGYSPPNPALGSV